MRIINLIEYPETNPALLSQTYRREGEKAYRKAARLFAQLKDDPARHQKLKNSPALTKARTLFLQSLLQDSVLLTGASEPQADEADQAFHLQIKGLSEKINSSVW